MSFHFVGSALLNRSQPNGLMPNNHGMMAIAADAVTCEDDHTKTQEYYLFLSDAVTSSAAGANAHGIMVGDAIELTDWVRAKVHDPNSDFE